MTICASHIERLIVYKHFGGSGGGRSIYCWLQLQITLIVIRLLQRTVKPGSTPLSNVKNQGRAINNFRCAFLIYGLVHCPYLGISNTAESCLANMPLANSTGPNEMLPLWHLIESVPFVNIEPVGWTSDSMMVPTYRLIY